MRAAPIVIAARVRAKAAALPVAGTRCALGAALLPAALLPAALLAGALLALGASAAHAAGFDPRAQKVSLEGAVLAVDFENPARLPVTAYDTAGNVVEATAREDGAHAIEGQRSLHLEGAARLVAVDLTPVREALLDRAIEIRLWQRPLGTRLTGDLSWTVDRVDLGALTVQPTGAVTTDGWEEWTTGPVDFALDGVTPPYLLLYDEQYFTSFVDLDRALSVALDAVTVVDLGPARVPRGACRVPDERARCGPAGACLFGRCADAAAVLGQPLLEPRLRAAAHARRVFEVATLEGNRRARERASGLAWFLARLSGADVPVLDYWTTLRSAYDGLSDARAIAPLAGGRPAVGGGGCAYLSDADLLPDRPLLPMIFETTPGHPLAERVRVGDVIRAIDGLSPNDWARAASRWLSYGGDPAGRHAQVAPFLLNAATVAGAVLSIERCSSLGAPCRADQVQRVEVDLGEVVQQAIAARELTPLTRRLICDFRFRRPVREDRAGRVTDYVGFDDVGRVRALQLNGLPADDGWSKVVDRALSPPPARILVDQRQGNGGTVAATELLVSRLVSAHDVARVELWPPIEATAARRAGLWACTATATAACGDFRALALRDPRRGEAASARVALLDGADVAGHEVLAEAVRRRTTGPTRIFAPAASWGAFGPATELTRLPGEVASVSLQTHDAIVLGPGEDHFGWLSGYGVEPTVRIYQRQSDALRGKDTLLEAALEWLEEGP